MFQTHDHYHDVSLRLSEVLDDIGVNQWLIEKRKKIWLLHEGSRNVEFQLADKKIRVFHFESQAEGSTTLGLHSDLDTLYVNYDIRVIPAWSEWKPFIGLSLLILRDQTNPPGYCLLQRIRSDVPLPVRDIQDNNNFTKDCRGRVLLKHSFSLLPIHGAAVRRGPAVSARNDSSPVFSGSDNVSSIYCPYWPKEANPWLHQQNPSGWLTEDIKRDAAQRGCFLVPVAITDSKHEDTEWRISTALAERILIYSLNLTQMKCYVLLKMITKSFLHPEFEDCVTSFVCKTVLFHIADIKDRGSWCERNLLTNLHACLQRLSYCIGTEKCPHFIIPGNNLLKGKLSPSMKHQLAEKMSSLIGDIVRALTGVGTDDLGTRLSVKFGRLSHKELASKDYIHGTVVSHNIMFVVSSVCGTWKRILTNLSKHGHAAVYEKLLQIVSKLNEIRTIRNVFEIRACNLIIPFLYTTLGSLVASADIARNRGLSPEALIWFSAGLDSDVSSSRLKLTSALYSAGEFERCEIILNDLETKFISLPLCFRCNCRVSIFLNEKFVEDICDKNEEDVIKENVSYCVKYLPSETCIPSELKYELYRSTGDDVQYREEDDSWMDWAVVDSLPYMYFLMYKVYNQLQSRGDQRRALDGLATTIHTKFGHTDTALNLLGQCYEQQEKVQEALCCFTMSLKVRKRNNAAKWHICTLLAAQFRQRQGLL